MSDYVKTEVRADGIAVVCLDRPDALNALNGEVFAGLEAAFADLARDALVRVVLLRGAGDKAFAAGSDIRMIQNSTEEEIIASSLVIKRLHEAIEAFPCPVIAVLNGIAFGGGLELALACDIRIASERAKFALPEIGLGIIPGGGGTQRAACLAGSGRAKLLIYTGDRIDAATAYDYGLIDMVVPGETLMDTAITLAGRIAAHSKVALREAKSAMSHSLRSRLDPGIDHERQCFVACFNSHDRKEGMQAFIERRKAVFLDR